MISVSQLAKQIIPEVIQWRRDFHQNPELGYEEFRTAELIAFNLEKWGYQVHKNIATIGIVAILNNQKSGESVCFRIDMDALPVDEDTNLLFASKIKGKMHACGHDMHLAIGLSLAKIISDNQNEFIGSISFIFQPGEELLSGAQSMIKDGVMDLITPKAILGFHIWNQIEIGKIAINPGSIMASIDAFQVEIIGRGGHGSSPHLSIDPIIAASQIVLNCQTIISKDIPAKKKAVLSITSFQSGDTINIIPQNAILKGSIRTYDEMVRKQIKTRFETIVKHTAQGMQCQINLKWLDNAPYLVNDSHLVSNINRIFKKLPYENIPNYQVMGSEDASFFWNRIPGCYSFIGAHQEGTDFNNAHHHPKFEIDEKAIKIGVEVMLSKFCEIQNIIWEY